MPALHDRFSQATGDAPIVPILLIMIGAYVAWFGVHYWEDTVTVWPSDPIKAVLQGKPLPVHTPATTAAIELTAAEQNAATSPGTGTNPQTTSRKAFPTGPIPSGTLSNAELQHLWVLAGGNPAKAGVAACIAEHESSGRPDVTSPNPDGGTNVGLWQLDTPGGKGAGYSVAQLKNPLTNARVAIRGSSNGTDWSAWSTAPMCGV